jgi:hypothetical protein
MAADPDRHSDGRPPGERRRALNEPPGGLHAAFQVAWALALAAPLALKVSALAQRPGTTAALGVIEISAVWTLVAALAWALRVLALSSCGRCGSRTRDRARRTRRPSGALR